MQQRRVVVTGLGALTPIGLGLSAYLDGLRSGVSGAAPIQLFDATGFRTTFACELKGFDVADYLDKKEFRRMDRFSQMAVISSDEAIADAGLNTDQLDRTRVGVLMGSGIGGLKTFEEEITKVAHQDEPPPRFNPFFIPKMIVDIAPGHISMKHGFQGPNYSTVSACATGTNALIDAYMLIQQGQADCMIAGGAEAAVNQTGIGGFNAMKALSTRNDEPATASRPFDQDRDGFVLGEGSGALVVETLEHAQARGAKIYAEIGGFGLSADAYHLTAPDPDSRGVVLMLRNLLRNAGAEPDMVDHINTHGTSTPLGDVAESNAIKHVFGEHAYNIHINSTKSMTGHLLGAAGAIEAIASILAIEHSFVPPTINHFTSDPDCDLDYTFNQARKTAVNAAVSNTFGFGGHNASVLFKKFHG